MEKMSVRMNVLKQNDKYWDYIGLVISIGLSVIVWVTVRLITGENDPQSSQYYWNFGYPALIIGCMFIAVYIPRNVWRWGLSIIIVQFLLEMLVPEGEYDLIPLGVMIHIVMIIPLLLCSYLAMWIWIKKKNAN